MTKSDLHNCHTIYQKVTVTMIGHLSKFVHINDTYAVARYTSVISCMNS